MQCQELFFRVCLQRGHKELETEKDVPNLEQQIFMMKLQTQ